MATSLKAVTTAAPAAAPSRFASRRTLALAGLLVVCALGASAFVIVRADTAPAPASAREPVKPIFVALEPVTVNLQSDGKPRFLHLGVTLKVNDERAQARVAETLPELRSRLLVLLSNRDPGSLPTPADKAKLADEIRAELNRPSAAGLPPYGITGVAFNAFVIQ